jgi:zinc ribbon protein
MQNCSSCGADLPEHARFCGKCGSAQNASATDAAALWSKTPQPPSWVPEGGTFPAPWPPSSQYPAQGSGLAWSPNRPVPTTPPPGAENEDERRRGIPPWSPQYGAALGGDALLGSGQVYMPGAPGVQGAPQLGSGLAYTSGTPGMPGTPQLGSIPSAAGSPTPYANALAGPAAQPQANVPVGRSAQPQANAPSPQARPQPTHSPPAQPATQDYHPAYQQHEHRTHHTQHTATSATKVAGGASAKAIMFVVAAVVVVAAGGIAAAAHFLSRPQPLISITSTYKVGTALAGAPGTILHISGQQFSSNSAITFLLDGRVAPGNPGTRSDANGNVSANVTITNAWSVGTHTLTARDASNDSTQNSVRVTIVQPGQANTPGPNGAPPDDASFKVIAQIQGSQSTETEVVTGHPDPMGGTVCQPEDNGQPSVITGFTFNSHTPYRETSTYSCAGSYKGGKITLTERFTSDVFVFSEPNGITTTCTLNSPQPQTDEQLSGSYAGNNTFSGTITYPTIPDSDYPCNGNGSSTFYNFHHGQSVNWTGQVTDLHS